MQDNMENIKNKSVLDSNGGPLRAQGVPAAANKLHNEKLHENKEGKKSDKKEPEYSLNDDRRVKVLSPGTLVAKRFFRNRVAVVGLTILIIMFLFSFVGGMVSPYTEDDLFYRMEIQNKDYAGVVKNDKLRYAAAPDQKFESIVQAQLVLALQQNKTEFTYRDVTYTVTEEGKDFYSVALKDGAMIGIAYKDIVSSSVSGQAIDFELQFAALKAYTNEAPSFTVGEKEYTLDADGVFFADGAELGYVSRNIVNPISPDIFISRAFKTELFEVIEAGEAENAFKDKESAKEFVFTENGEEYKYTVAYDPASQTYTIKQGKETRVYDTYSAPSATHPLGTDRNGMDMLTRLMYGGRISLVIGFVVEFIATFLGVILGGLAGYFGKWVDNLIMRIVDVFYCIPSMPILIILGAMMDAMRVDPMLRMLYLMLILGFLGWPGIARMVRGQILSLREQEFMTATEACGISVSRRIFRHLIPNVIPQLIVSCTMGLGSTIITEATLSFLGLGVKFPFASWGNIINDVSNTYVLTEYWFIWIPAGICLLLTVVAFNLVGDGLRDAFDPKMKR